MAKNFLISFGSGNPATFTGLTPTFTVFKVLPAGGATTPPGITEVPSSTGLYYFTYSPLSAIAFVIDGGSALNSTIRYISSALDPIQAVDEAIGATTSSFGGTATDPATLYGYLKRLQEFNEGNATFTKSSGVWDIYSRGSSTLLIEKVLTNATATTTKV